MSEHEHEFVSVPGGRMLVRCERGHEHEVLDHPGFEACPCGEWKDDNYTFLCDDKPTLDEAWRRAVAALPKGYAIMLRGSNDWMGREPFWKADAYHSDGRRRTVYAEGPTPIAALLAIAYRLAEAK